MPSILRWEDPAPRTPASDEYAPLAAELMKNPGKWAVIAEHPDTQDGRRAASRLFNAAKHGYLGFPRIGGGTFKATTRTVNNGDGTRVITVHAMFDPAP
ncbi:hypothetical protein ACQEVF_59230 [Nonomuraea polychroma]|uniref:hypothetical protein n=1 Tax=Nonomuraea polychroma TaxID=46176 RepID=UPI003D8A66D2